MNVCVLKTIQKNNLEEFKRIIFMGDTVNKREEMTSDVQDCVYLYVKNQSKSR